MIQEDLDHVIPNAVRTTFNFCNANHNNCTFEFSSIQILAAVVKTKSFGLFTLFKSNRSTKKCHFKELSEHNKSKGFFDILSTC